VRSPPSSTRSITWGRVDLDAELPADHEVRAIAAVVDPLDLRGLHADVRARGAPATQSATLLLGLWGHATRDGVRSDHGDGFIELRIAVLAVSEPAGQRGGLQRALAVHHLASLAARARFVTVSA